MIISHKHKFIFFKSMKAASTSLEVSLTSVCGADDVITEISYEGLTGYEHPVKNDDGFFNHIWENYYKISSVRNSWDKLVSHWCWRQREDWLPRYGNKRRGKQSFGEYLETDEIFKWTPELVNLSEWLSVNGEICTDFLIRFEHLNKDFSSLCAILNISPAALPQAKSGFRKDRKPYWKYYGERQKEIAAKRCETDIKNFNSSGIIKISFLIYFF